MKEQVMYQVDAFTDQIFGGNPAAVCVIESWWSDELMQQIAQENNLAETAFIVLNVAPDLHHIRWFTPVAEVDLCGHATLASAHVLFEYFFEGQEVIRFQSRSGELSVQQMDDGRLRLDFPQDEFEQIKMPDLVRRAFEPLTPFEAYQGKDDYMIIFESENEIRKADPDLALLKKADRRGLMITAPGDEVDFVSRFFAPQYGIDEDPVTGSAHTTMTPYWSERLGKTKLSARQLSSRLGVLECEMHGERVLISGHAVTYLKGIIYLS